MRQASSPMRPVLAALVAATALLPVRAHGEERTWRELERALAALETPLGGAPPPAVSSLLAELEQTDVARQREFAAAAALKLPARAAERLARAREAYAAGHGRLLGVLRELARGPSGAAAKLGIAPSTLENKIRSLSELAVNRQEPDYISGQVDQVAASMMETEKTMNDLRFVTGLDTVDEAPSLLQSEITQPARAKQLN